MIPIKLAMRNFMCYRDNVPPLYFDSIHTACISGDNGNGKSALIDAITWALWGKTRAKNDDDLVHSGQSEMEVEFDFAVGQQRYRIIRKHSRPKRRGRSGQTILELQAATADGFRSITGDRIAQTQQKIIGLLHMDYDTFVNSAFLRQGHADQFTRQPPVKRKEVLSNILGLSIYDELEEQAKSLAKQQDIEKAQLESALEDINNELAQKPTRQAEFEQAQGELSQVEKETKEQDSRLNGLRQEKESLERKKVQLAQLETHITETERNLERWVEQGRQHRSRVEEYEELIVRRAAIEEGYARFVEARKLCDELNQKLGAVVKMRERRSQLKEAIGNAQAVLLKDHALAQSRISELEAEAHKLPQYKNELQQMQVQRRQLAELEETLHGKRHMSQEVQTRVYHQESNKTQMERQIKEIEERLDLLSTPSGAKCPLCETELGMESLKLIEAKYVAERESKSDLLKSNQAELVQKKTEIKALESEIARLETRLNHGRASVHGKTSVLDKSIAEAEEAGSKLDGGRKALTGIEQRLAGKDFAVAEQEALRQLDNELAGLDYDSDQHEQARQRLGALEQYEQPQQRLEEADRLIIQEKGSASGAEETARELRHSLEIDNQKRQDLAMEPGSLPRLAGEVTQAEIEHQALIARQTQAQEKLWSVKTKLERYSELEIRKKEKEKLLGLSSKEEKIYKDLAQAFGKRGIQAMLIEIAIPGIEIEANKLLTRMTDNRMHVKIETQRETKKGEVVETLDINITDELGTRNYEMFSGGEAFRINFAVRIALSKLLARRAGAPLPTLIIDEGFGTQDSTGIEKLKEAINSIQDDFEKILVITHVEELRDAFPTRIDVIKTAAGSTIHLS